MDSLAIISSSLSGYFCHLSVLSVINNFDHKVSCIACYDSVHFQVLYRQHLIDSMTLAGTCESDFKLCG